MKVTRIEVQQKRKGRYSIYVDEKFYAGMEEALLAQSGLHPGRELTQNDLFDLDRLLDLGKVRESALRSLSIRLNSTAELRRKLRQKNFEEELIDEAIQWLMDKGLLDDRLFAERWLEFRRASSGYGSSRIQSELLRKGIDKAIIQDLERPSEDDEIGSALDYLEKKFDKESIETEREKAMRSLSSRGFQYSTIRTALKLFSDEN